MTNRHKAFLLRAFLSILTATLWAQNDTSSRPEYLYEKEHPLRETRAVWLTTIGGLDWPRIWATDASSRERQKEELVRILDNYQRANINTVIFQTRVRAALLYPSKIEPWEMSLTGIPGQSPGYDPLAFCIDECHKRGMELHAWVVCIPIGTKQRQNGYGAASLIRKHPELVKTAKGGEMFMIPGKPETADYIASICREIVENYDVDGISLDYIRYPESTFNYSDDELYPRASNLSKAEWRRENITRIVRRVHDVVKPIKPWVKLSSSPIGKYADTRRYSAGGWNCYNAVWQDPKLWLRENLQDMLFPMMYFTGDNYYPFLFDWLENSYGHPIVPGLGIYFPARMTWMGDTIAPPAPTALRYDKEELSWNSLPFYGGGPGRGSSILYNVYGSNLYPVDVTKAENLLAARVTDTRWTLNARAQKVRHYAVTAIDRFGNESPALQEPKPDFELPKHIDVPKLINPVVTTRKAATKTKKSKKKKKK